jgi:hypothetical protein
MYNVYLICSYVGNSKLYKIGYTRRNVEDRIKDFKTGNCSNIEIIDSFNSKWGTKIEAILHKKFKSQEKNISGEWFNLNDHDISLFKSDCEKIHNNFELITNENTYYLEKNKF